MEYLACAESLRRGGLSAAEETLVIWAIYVLLILSGLFCNIWAISHHSLARVACQHH